MRITKQGKIPTKFEGDWGCIHCSCEWVLAACDNDLVSVYSDQGVSGYRMWCPACGHVVFRKSV